MGTLAVVGLALSAASMAYSGYQQNQQAKYQAAVARNNAVVADRAAQDAITRGGIDANRQRAATRQAVGRSRASAASRGVVVDEGSAGDTAADITGAGALDALTLQSNSEREALGLQTQGQNFRNEAYMTRRAGKQAQTDAFGGAFGTLLTGGGTVANRWLTR